MRRRAIVGSMAVLAASALVVGMSATVAGAGGKKAAVPLCAGKTKKQAIKKIGTAYKYFLDYATAGTAQDKEPYIQYLSGKDASPALIAQFEESAAKNAAAAATTSVRVNKVTCAGKKKADVDFDLVLNGTPAEDLAPPGEAIYIDKTWKVTGLTLCNLQALGDPLILEDGPCSEIALGDAPSDAGS
jgi:hypothetical protein